MSLKNILRNARSKRKLSKYTSQSKQVLVSENKSDLESLLSRSLELKAMYEDGQLSEKEIAANGIELCSISIHKNLGYYPYNCQIIGSLAICGGNIIEMGTGEGKTLTAIISAYLNYLKGESTHIVTVNDYLSQRDSNLAEKILSQLGATVGWTSINQDLDQKQEEYKKDILYGTTQALGFDYLRNYITVSANEVLGQKRENIIIDEVDSVLIDEARTPLGTSSDINRDEGDLGVFNDIAQKILPNDENFVLDRQKKKITLTENGYRQLEDYCFEYNLIKDRRDIYDQSHQILFKIENALLAHSMYLNGVDYLVDDQKIIPIDQETGRLQRSRKWRGGIHEAIETKEGLEISRETMTVLSTTIQNFYLKYNKISGMTGTASTNSEEYEAIYGLDTIIIPPNKKSNRVDLEDKIYTKKQQKHLGILNDIKEKHSSGRPVLICTTSVEESKEISELLSRSDLPHSVLNAENHKNEATIIKNAGRRGAITVSTNMAGRGSDIVLGGDYEKFIMTNTVKGLPKDEAEKLWKKEKDKINNLGGLHVIGTQHYETRRADLQMRGRCGRQGDNGSTRVYVSLDDNIFKLVGGASSYQKIFSMVGVGDYGIENITIRKAIERVQKKIEGANYDRRQYLVKYDNIDSGQRDMYFCYREKLLSLYNPSGYIKKIIDKQFSSCKTDDDIFKKIDELQITKFINYSKSTNCTPDTIFESLEKKLEGEPESLKLLYYKQVCLEVLKSQWAKHIQDLTEIKSTVGHRITANKNPFVEYKLESSKLFKDFFNKAEALIIKELFDNEIKKNHNRVDVDAESQILKAMSKKIKTKRLNFSRDLTIMMEKSIEYGIKF